MPRLVPLHQSSNQMTRPVVPRQWAAAAAAAMAASLAVLPAIAELSQKGKIRPSPEGGLVPRQLSYNIGSTMLEHFTAPSPGGQETSRSHVLENPSFPESENLSRLRFYTGVEGEIPPRPHPPFAASKPQHRYGMGGRPVGHSGHKEEETTQWKIMHFCKKHYGAWKNCPLSSYIKEPRQ